MKANRISVAAAVVAALAIFASLAIAGSVYGRKTVTLAATTGVGSWTNTEPYAALALKRIWIENSLSNASTVTVSRVSLIDSVSYTQTVGTVALAGSTSGSQATLTAAYLANGDTLTFAGAVATGATAIVEYEVQKH